MADMTEKKTTYLKSFVTYAGRAAALAREIKEMDAYATANGLKTGGANVIVDADCTGDAKHLTAALLNSGITAMGTMQLSVQNADILRQCSNSPVP